MIVNAGDQEKNTTKPGIHTIGIETLNFNIMIKKCEKYKGNLKRVKNKERTN